MHKHGIGLVELSKRNSVVQTNKLYFIVCHQNARDLKSMLGMIGLMRRSFSQGIMLTGS